MLYAEIKTKEAWADIPSRWDKVQDMYAYLRKQVSGLPVFYQLLMERRMLSYAEDMTDFFQYRATIVKWEGQLGGERSRTVMVESNDPAQVEATLVMLLSITEDARRQHGVRIV
jgi:hypothetical protein